MRCASVHAAFFKEDVESLASRITEGLSEPLPVFFQEKNLPCQFVLSKSFDVNSHLANAGCFD